MIKKQLNEFFEPLFKKPKSVVLTTVSLALVLVFLHQGSSHFFEKHLAKLIFSSPADLRNLSALRFWAVIYQFGSAFFLFLVLPALALKVLTKEPLTSYGLGLGEGKLGFAVVLPLGIFLLAIPSALSAASMQDFLSEYPLAKYAVESPTRFLFYELAYGLLFYVSYESFFRGFLQFGLRDEIGEAGAICVQTTMTTLLHLGKPLGEIWSALIAGLLFGVIAFRIRSIWPLVLIHWALGFFTDYFCAHAAGIL